MSLLVVWEGKLSFAWSAGSTSAKGTPDFGQISLHIIVIVQQHASQQERVTFGVTDEVFEADPNHSTTTGVLYPQGADRDLLKREMKQPSQTWAGWRLPPCTPGISALT